MRIPEDNSDVNFVEWLNTEPRIETVFAGHTHQTHIFHDVLIEDIYLPDDRPSPSSLNTLYFSDMAFYIETDTACKEY